jgi:deoxyribodipyrimidine photo-lyase
METFTNGYTSRKVDRLTHLSSNPRVTVRKPGDPSGKCVVYWMQRSQRALDNPALETAVNAANALKLPCVVFFAPVPFYPHANLRHYRFLNQGIPSIASGLEKRNIGFVLRRYPDHGLLKFCDQVNAALLVGDENPMREPEHWRQVVAKRVRIPFWTVDSDVIVPSKLLEKEQYGAYTIRPRIHRMLPEFLQPIGNGKAKVQWKKPHGLKTLPIGSDITEGWDIDRSVPPVDLFSGGTDEGLKHLKRFITQQVAGYEKDRNKPELHATSLLSPYLHFGHLGPHTVALAIQEADSPKAAKDAYLEQLIVRRELAINFVHFNPDYDNFESAPDWAHKSLAEHAKDPRRLYSKKEMEEARTDDPLWNASQRQMLHAGWMHNYMRMYWAKKILEWSRSPAEAFQFAVYLNDKYFVDGRDPNGYAGIAWAMVGKHDRPWFDRPVFGQIRYMAFNSTSKKFNSRLYMEQMGKLADRARVEHEAPAKEEAFQLMAPSEKRLPRKSRS